VAVDCRSAGQLSTLFCRSDYRIAGRKADIADLAPLELAVIGYSTGNPWGWREAADRRLREAATSRLVRDRNRRDLGGQSLL